MFFEWLWYDNLFICHIFSIITLKNVSKKLKKEVGGDQKYHHEAILGETAMSKMIAG